MKRGFSAEERLLVLLNLVRLSETEQEELGELAKRGAELDWSELHRLAELNAVLPLSLKRLQKLGLEKDMPTDLRERWQSQAGPIRERGERRAAWTGRLLGAMADAGIEVIVLKGSLFADEIYRDRAYKKMNDVDVLIRREDAERAISVLKALEFESVGELLGRDELSAGSHHTPPYVSGDLACVVGLHWGLVSPRSRWKPDTAGLWQRKEVAPVAGAPAFRLSWEDNLLHLCIHLPFFKTGLRELADVCNVARHAPVDWKALARRAQDWRAEEPVARVLTLADALAELDVSDDVRQAWIDQAGAFSREDLVRRLADPSCILRSRSTQAGKIEKAYAIFKLTENHGERVKAWAGMWAMLLWPKRSELAKLAAVRELRPATRAWALARFRAPAQLWNAMALDHGHLPLAVMTAANAGIVVSETARWAWKGGRTGRSLREHPAAKLLEVLE